MTLKTTKGHLVQLLADQENKVIALSGKWGTMRALCGLLRLATTYCQEYGCDLSKRSRPGRQKFTKK